MRPATGTPDILEPWTEMLTLEWLPDWAFFKNVLSTLIGLGLGVALLHLKRRVYGRWAVDIVIDGVTVETEYLALGDAQKAIGYGRPWWWVLAFGGTPALENQTGVRQLLQSCVTSFGVVTRDVRKSTAVDAARRRLVISLVSGENFKPHAPPGGARATPG